MIWCAVHTTTFYFNQQLLRCGHVCLLSTDFVFISLILINRWHFQAIYLNQMIADWLLNQRFSFCFIGGLRRVCFMHESHGCCTGFQVNESFSHFKIILSCRDDKVFFCCYFFFVCWMLLLIPFHSLSQSWSYSFSSDNTRYYGDIRTRIYINLIMLLWSLFTYI